MIEHKLFPNSTARGFTPASSIRDLPGFHGSLAQESAGDWFWKPDRYDGGGDVYRFFVTGPRCRCTLQQPVGTNCARHN